MYCKICGKKIYDTFEICNECKEKRKQYSNSKFEHQINDDNTTLVNYENVELNTNNFSNNNLIVNSNNENTVNQSLNNNNERHEKENLKIQIIKYIFPIYLCFIILVAMAYFTLSSVDDNGFNMLGYMLIWAIIIVLVTVILSIILSKRNIKNNYDNLQKSNNKKIIINILNSLLLYTVITTIIYKAISIVYVNYSLYELYLTDIEEGIKIFLAPILIPIIKFFNKDNHVSKDSVNKVVFLLYIIIGIILRFIFSIINIAFMLPLTIIGLQNNSNTVKNTKRNDIIVLIVLLIILSILIFGFNFISNEIYMDPTKSNSSEDLYCMIPFKTQNNNIYYYASKSKECIKSYPVPTIDVSKNLYSIDNNLNINAVASGINNDDHIGVYEFPTDKLYFNISLGGSLYEVNNNSKYKKIIDGNISILGYYNNEIYYESYSKNSIERLNLTDYKKTKLKNIKDPNKIISGYKNVIIYEESNSNNVYEYNLDTNKNRKIDSFNISNSYYEKDNKLYTITDYNTVAVYDMQTKEIKEIPVKGRIFNHNVVILGIYNNNLYYINYGYDDYTIKGIDLGTGEVKLILSTGFDEYGSYLKEKGKNLALLKENYIYYSDTNDLGKLYRIDLTNNIKEIVSDHDNSIIFDVIDNYVYYTSYDNNTKKNSFWRIKDNDAEVVIQ